MFQIVIAPNAFKGSLPAKQVAAAIQAGLEKSRLHCRCHCFPVGDGGDGTGILLIEQLGGTEIRCTVSNPFGKKIPASYGLIDQGQTAVIEMANASGLRLLEPDQYNPMTATSVGTGEMIRYALDQGVRQIIIGMGGSATVDGGMGILQALGIRFLDPQGRALPPQPERLQAVHRIDDTGLDQRIRDTRLMVLCDVDNPLLGPLGAATVFGPQKGACPATVARLEAILTSLRDITRKQKEVDLTALPHGGTAGGAAAGLHAWLNAELLNGIDYFLQLTGFEKTLENCDLLITAEGSIDFQTLQGKAPAGVARIAKSRGIPVLGLSGRVDLEKASAMEACFDVLLPIGNEPSSLQTAMERTAANLSRTATELGNLLALRSARDIAFKG